MTGTIDLAAPLGSPMRWQTGTLRLQAIALTASLWLFTAPAFGQGGEKTDSIGEDAVDAVTQPLSDLNLRSKDIPPILRRAQIAPYQLYEMDDCTALNTEIMDLEEVLGPDADAPPDKDGLFNKGLQLGGNILGGFIPFRGVIRQISGANAERAKLEAAIYSGVARRSYLKGFAKGRGCLAAEQTPVQSPEEVLGLGGE